MYCEQREKNGNTVLECFGRFDEGDSSHFIQTLQQLHEQGAHNIILNLTPVFYLDPKVINLLLFAHDFFYAHGGKISLVSPLSSVRNELLRGMIPEIIPTFETLYSALHRPHSAYIHPSQESKSEPAKKEKAQEYHS